MAPYYFWIIKKLACIEKTVKRKGHDIYHSNLNLAKYKILLTFKIIT